MSGAPPSLPRTDDVRALTEVEADRLLARVRLPRSAPDSDYLAALQWRFLCASPFHNLELLAGTSPRTAEAAIEAVVAGRGGPCHVQAAGFLALLRHLGFDADLAAATIRQPGDHLVVVVRTGLQRWVCDVGNGHPYRRPFGVDGTTRSEHLGWTFAASGDGVGLQLGRRMPNGAWRVVYRVDLRPRRFADFAGIIDGHHGQAGFGPFLTGLRAVLIDDDRVVALRDLELKRYSRLGAQVRPVPDLAAARRVLRRTFDFGLPLIDAALERVASHATQWAAPSPGPVRVAITLATTDRPAALRRLLSSIAADARRADSGLVSPPLVVVVDNGRTSRSACAEIVREACASGLDVRRIDDGRGGRSIASSRRAQVEALAQFVDAGESIDAVWMLDDDVQLAQRVMQGGCMVDRRGLIYLDEIARRARRHPEVSVLVGGVTGDPPIRPDAVLATQLLDLTANLDRFAALDPESGYSAPEQTAAFDLPDYYYDHSRQGNAHLERPFWWVARAARSTVRAEALQFLDAMRGIYAGKTPTRPLLWRPERPSAAETWLHRGGNAVFLDLDSLWRHPYPSVSFDGWRTRRADMVGTALLHRGGGAWPARWNAPVLHERCSATAEGESSAAVRRSMLSEFFGVLLVRAVLDGHTDLFAVARSRTVRVLDTLAAAAARLDTARAAIERARHGWLGSEAECSRALDVLERALTRGEAALFGGSTPAFRARWRRVLEAEMLDDRRISRIAEYAQALIGASPKPPTAGERE